MHNPNRIGETWNKDDIFVHGVKHGSKHCFAVQIAKELLAKGVNPVGAPELADYSRWWEEKNEK